MVIWRVFRKMVLMRDIPFFCRKYGMRYKLSIFRSSDALYKDEISSESIYGTLRIKESKKSAIISHPFGNYAK